MTNAERSKKWRELNPERNKLLQKLWRDRNKEYVDIKGKEWVKNNKEKRKKIAREWARRNRKSLNEWVLKNPEKRKIIANKWAKNKAKEEPWYKSYSAARHRCAPSGVYYKKGIKFLMTKEEFHFLWIRDNANLMIKPSIDRIDPNGDYVLSNCRFLEIRDNVIRALEKRWGYLVK